MIQQPNIMECIEEKDIDNLMTQLTIFFLICLLLPSSHEIVICACDVETKAGKEVHVPNQACTYWKSYWGTGSKEVCRDEEDGKCSLRISSSAYLLALALIRRVCCSNFPCVGVLLRKSLTKGHSTGQILMDNLRFFWISSYMFFLSRHALHVWLLMHRAGAH